MMNFLKITQDFATDFIINQSKIDTIIVDEIFVSYKLRLKKILNENSENQIAKIDNEKSLYSITVYSIMIIQLIIKEINQLIEFYQLVSYSFLDKNLNKDLSSNEKTKEANINILYDDLKKIKDILIEFYPKNNKYEIKNKNLFYFLYRSQDLLLTLLEYNKNIKKMFIYNLQSFITFFSYDKDYFRKDDKKDYKNNPPIFSFDKSYFCFMKDDEIFMNEIINNIYKLITSIYSNYLIKIKISNYNNPLINIIIQQRKDSIVELKRMININYLSLQNEIISIISQDETKE